MLALQPKPESQPAIMALPRANIIVRVTGLEPTINEHLIKLLALNAREDTRAVWRKEIARHLRHLSKLRLKPRASNIKGDDWWEWLYDGPFGGVELGYTQAHIDNLEAEEFVRNGRSTEEVHQLVREFYLRMCRELSEGRPGIELIPV